MSSITRAHNGYRVGECHQNAKLTDEQVKEMRYLRERYGKTYKQLAEQFQCGESTVRDIVKWRTRWAI